MADNDEKIIKAILSLHADVLDIKKTQQKQGKDIQVVQAVKDAVILVDMKVQAGNSKADKNTTELKEELAKKADKADVISLKSAVMERIKRNETRITELEEDQGIRHRDKN